MTDSFIQSVQKLASSVSSDKNGFPWDSAIRRFQYGVAGITLAALAIYDTTSKVQCSTPSSLYPEFLYASSYCHEATWYHVTNGTKIPYEQFLRNFKWYVLIHPVVMITMVILYGASVDSFLLRVIKKAEEVLIQGETDIEDSATIEGIASACKTLAMAVKARVFAGTYLHFKKSDKNVVKNVLTYSEDPTDGISDEGGDFELSRLDYWPSTDEIDEVHVRDKVGHRTALCYHFYLGVCVVINVCALGFINPYFFSFPSEIACEYHKEDMSKHWCICSVPGHRYSKAALIIVMVSYAFGVIAPLLSFIYLNHYIPKQLRRTNAAISSYTLNVKQQEKINQWWNKFGKQRLQYLTATTRFILALIYQNIDRTLCYRLVVAMIDIEKDKEAINRELPKQLEDIVEIDEGAFDLISQDKEEIICEMRETVLNPAAIDRVKHSIQNDLLLPWVAKYLDDPAGCRRDLLKAEMVHQVLGVQLPNQSKLVRKKISDLMRSTKETDFIGPIPYYRHIAALYNISKNRSFFSLFEPMEIGKIYDPDSSEHAVDSGHLSIDNHEFDARKLFYNCGYCYRSKNITAYNWIRRSWNHEYSIKFVAIQASHVNEMATPTSFNLTVTYVDRGKVVLVDIRETFQTFNWLKDEWRVFPVFVHDVSGNRECPVTKSMQVNMFKNGGADYFEIQKMRVYGTAL